MSKFHKIKLYSPHINIYKKKKKKLIKKSLNEFLRDSLSGSYNNLKKRFSNIFMEINANDLSKIESMN
ncbi:hypothetical protein PFNF135_05352 [Plasmodium falciparum NF135/5.C10]|uniref:Uncharacterized protein n=1 Tax=Plasmodium falciparum NF135/5.C10 TaxID=1036726 RepID=W4IB05_PLAFA|nr:hypothetical protein PFNF135_05352 [Plasmodium falciparum NF135/5.C10]